MAQIGETRGLPSSETIAVAIGSRAFRVGLTAPRAVCVGGAADSPGFGGRAGVGAVRDGMPGRRGWRE